MKYSQEARWVVQIIPVLIYADVVLIMAGFIEEVHKLLDISEEEGHKWGLT